MRGFGAMGLDWEGLIVGSLFEICSEEDEWMGRRTIVLLWDVLIYYSAKTLSFKKRTFPLTSYRVQGYIIS